MCRVIPRACGEPSVGEELTRSRSALTLSGSCSRSSGVSGNSVRLNLEERGKGSMMDGWMDGRSEKQNEGEREGDEVYIYTTEYLPLKATYCCKKHYCGTDLSEYLEMVTTYNQPDNNLQ